MPDFTIEIMQQCRKGGLGEYMHLGGYDQFVIYSERVRSTCTCKGFQFRKHCKHLDEAYTKLCNYHQQIDGPPEKDGVCPKCGGPTDYVQVAV